MHMAHMAHMAYMLFSKGLVIQRENVESKDDEKPIPCFEKEYINYYFHFFSGYGASDRWISKGNPVLHCVFLDRVHRREQE